MNIKGTESLTETRFTIEKITPLFGKPMDAIAMDLFPMLRPKDRDLLMAACIREEDRAIADWEGDLLYEGVEAAMRKLKAAGCRLFIVSNCQAGYIELFLQKSGLADVVEDFESYGSTGLYKAENIRLVMDRHGLKPGEGAYVGDIEGDYQASVKAGIPFVHAAYGFGKVPLAKCHISGFGRLLDLCPGDVL